jgi:hypothetical protein
MNTTDLPAQIRECVSQGASPITLDEIKAKAAMPERAVRRAPFPRRGRLAVAAAGAVAAGVAGALVASQVGGAPAAAGPVLTTAMLKHLASASQMAMTSGQADIVWVGSGATVIQDVTFDGANWNDVNNPGQPIRVRHFPHGIAWTGESIERVVDGQAYHYPAFGGGGVIAEWIRFTGPASVAGPLDIPDPRSLVSVLSPSAGLAADGSTTVNGVSLQHLRATTPGAVALQPLNDVIQSEPYDAQASALDLWVDSSGVVLKAEITVTGNSGPSTELSQAGIQAVQRYNKEHGTHINPQMLPANPANLAAMARIGKLNPSWVKPMTALLSQPGMTTTVPGSPQSVTVTVTFSHIGQPQTITVPTDIVQTVGPHR